MATMVDGGEGFADSRSSVAQADVSVSPTSFSARIPRNRLYSRVSTNTGSSLFVEVAFEFSLRALVRLEQPVLA